MNLLLSLHSFLRWAILILLLIVIVSNFINKKKAFTSLDRTWVLRLLIVTHINFLIGLIQYFVGDKGFAFIKMFGMKEVMHSAIMRFYAVEHITGMLVAVILITIASSISKKTTITDTQKHNKLFVLSLIAFIIIVAVIPWPCRAAFNGMPWLRGL